MHNVRPDTITITERVTEELRSRTADVRATATELHWLNHHSATDSALLRALRRSRIEEEDVAVENITKAGHGSWIVFFAALAAGASSFVLGHQLVAPAGLFILLLVLRLLGWNWPRSTTWHLRIKCCDDEQVGRALDAIASVRGAQVCATRWRYDVPAVARGEWVKRGIARANTRAEEIAHSLGARIVGVASYVEEHAEPSGSYGPVAVHEMGARRTSSPAMAFAGGATGGFELAGEAPASVTITIDYRVSPRP